MKRVAFWLGGSSYSANFHPLRLCSHARFQVLCAQRPRTGYFGVSKLFARKTLQRIYLDLEKVFTVSSVLKLCDSKCSLIEGTIKPLSPEPTIAKYILDTCSTRLQDDWKIFEINEMRFTTCAFPSRISCKRIKSQSLISIIGETLH